MVGLLLLFIWLSAVGLTTLFFWEKLKIKFVLDKKIILDIFVLVFLGIAILYIYGGDIYHYHYDEEITAYTSYSLPKLGGINWLGAVPKEGEWVSQFPIFYHILQKPFLLISPSVFMIRVSNWPYILGTIIILYLLCKEIYSRKFALITTIFYIFFAAQIYIGSLGLHFHSSTFLFLSSLYFFIRLIKYKKYFDAIMLGILMAFSYMTYTSSYITAPIVFLGMAFFTFKDRSKQILLSFLKVWSIFFVTLLPVLIYAFSINNFFKQRLNQVNLFSGTWRGQNEISTNFSSFLNIIWEHTSQAFLSLFLKDIGGMGEYWYGHESLFEPIGFFFFIIGFLLFIFSLRFIKKLEIGILIISLVFISVLGFILTTHPPPFHRLSIAYPLIAICMAEGFLIIISFLSKNKLKFLNVLLITGVVFYSLSNISHVNSMIQKDKGLKTFDILTITKYLKGNVPSKTPIYIATFPANALGKEIFFRTKAAYPIMTNYFPALKIKKKNSIIIVHRPSDESLKEVFVNYPDAKLISSVHLFDYAIIKL